MGFDPLQPVCNGYHAQVEGSMGSRDKAFAFRQGPRKSSVPRLVGI